MQGCRKKWSACVLFNTTRVLNLSAALLRRCHAWRWRCSGMRPHNMWEGKQRFLFCVCDTNDERSSPLLAQQLARTPRCASPSSPLLLHNHARDLVAEHEGHVVADLRDSEISRPTP